jgi:hypothetical protein
MYAVRAAMMQDRFKVYPTIGDRSSLQGSPASLTIHESGLERRDTEEGRRRRDDFETMKWL